MAALVKMAGSTSCRVVSGSGALAELPKDDAAQLAAGLTTLAMQYDIVLIDLAAGIDANVMRLARAADRALIVANDEPTSMTDAYAFIKVLRGYAPSVAPWIAVNMADTRVAGRRTYEALARASQTFLGFRPPLAGVILRDAKVREAIRTQKKPCRRFTRMPRLRSTQLRSPKP